MIITLYEVSIRPVSQAHTWSFFMLQEPTSTTVLAAMEERVDQVDDKELIPLESPKDYIELVSLTPQVPCTGVLSVGTVVGSISVREYQVHDLEL